MSKCIRCGCSFWTHGKIKLKDSLICFKCFDELGFDHKLELASARNSYTYDEIKNGREAYEKEKFLKHERWKAEHEDLVLFTESLHVGDDDPETEDENDEG